MNKTSLARTASGAVIGALGITFAAGAYAAAICATDERARAQS